ncbi:MAG: M23 family metallopeptidase [Chitinophagales bacterium]|nr:M23 family metallopeptidase [Bacteroidota bacterium]MCB9255991.1 M23 family metallopeptidase [Chitinophagales bacterium]
MAKDKNITNKKTFLERLRYKYRLIILNEDTFEQKTSLRLSRMNLYVLGSVFFLIVVAIVTAVIAFTPLKYYMPGVGSVDVRSHLIEVEMLTDSLQEQLDKRNAWLKNVQMVLSGELDSTFFMSDSSHNFSTEGIDLNEVSDVELDFKTEVQQEIALLEMPVIPSTEGIVGAKYALHFVAPVNGLVISEYDQESGHFGVDIAGMDKEAILAVESGIVIVADWNPETGYVLGIQHKNSAISFYKHNSKLLKKVGSFVSKGDVVALMGNSGELSNGPHLHFELWQNGKSLNPLDYIDLKKIN